MGHTRDLKWASAALLVRALVAIFVAGVIVAGIVRGVASRARRSAEKRYVRSRGVNIMSTDVNVTAVSADEAAARRAAAGALARMDGVERRMSAFRKDSEVSRCNRDAAREPVAVSAETMRAIRAGLRFGEVTNGAFDITVGPLVVLWIRCAGENRMPTSAELNAARALVGFRGVTLDETAGTVRFARAGMKINLGGVAKGLAVDAAYAELSRSGFPDTLVEAGGDLYAAGLRLDGGPWLVGVQDPRTGKNDTAKCVTVLRVSDRGVATSGNYRRFSVIQGRRISHILDPRTGQPADTVASVTIVAPDCGSADALATGVSVLGLEKGMKLVNSMPDVEALLVTVENGELKLHRSQGFAKYEVKDAAEPTTVTR